MLPLDDAWIGDDALPVDDVWVVDDVLPADDVWMVDDVLPTDDVPPLDDVWVTDDVPPLDDVWVMDDVPPLDDVSADPVCGDGQAVADMVCLQAAPGLFTEGAPSVVLIADWAPPGNELLFAQDAAIYRITLDAVETLSPQFVALGLATPVSDLVAADINGDSNTDLVVGVAVSNPRVLLGDGAGGVAGTYDGVYGEGTVNDVAVADIVGTSSEDDFAFGCSSGCGAIDQVSLDVSQAPTFTGYQVCAPTHVELAHIDGLSTRFISASGTTLQARTIQPKTGQANLTLTEPSFTTTLPGQVVRLLALDLTGDGRDDVVALTSDDHVSVYAGDGTTGFQDLGGVDHLSWPVGAGATDVVAGDFDGDGDRDLAVSGGADDSITVLVNRGTGNVLQAGSFEPLAFSLEPGDAPARLAAGDLNGDGIDDLAIALPLKSQIGFLVSDP